jgi:hypothetical protein
MHHRPGFSKLFALLVRRDGFFGLREASDTRKTVIGITAGAIIFIALLILLLSGGEEPIELSGAALDRFIGRRLAEELSQNVGEGTLLVAFQPGDEAVVEGIRQGVDAEVQPIEMPPIGEAAMTSVGEMDRQLTEFYDGQLADPPADGIVLLGDLPSRPGALELFRQPDPPPIACLGNWGPNLVALIRNGSIDVLVAGTPTVHVMKKGEEKSPEQLFEERYMLVTPQNVNKILRQYPLD